MHELSIAEAVVEIATRHAAGRRVYAVDVRIGHLRQVVPSALDFAFELASQGTSIEGAELRIEHVPAEGVCRLCGTRTVMSEFPLQCRSCGDLNLELTAGEELQVESLELESPPENSSRTSGGAGSRQAASSPARVLSKYATPAASLPVAARHSPAAHAELPEGL